MKIGHQDQEKIDEQEELKLWPKELIKIKKSFGGQIVQNPIFHHLNSNLWDFIFSNNSHLKTSNQPKHLHKPKIPISNNTRILTNIIIIN